MQVVLLCNDHASDVTCILAKAICKTWPSSIVLKATRKDIRLDAIQSKLLCSRAVERLCLMLGMQKEGLH